MTANEEMDRIRAELEAMERICEVLVPMEPGQRAWVLRTAASYLEMKGEQELLAKERREMEGEE